MTTVKTIEKIDAREIRRKLGLNQRLSSNRFCIVV